MLGLVPGSYEAYCLDQAVAYVGSTIENEMNEASEKPDKEQRKAIAARQRVLDKYLSEGQPDTKTFVDPATFFGAK